MKSAATSARPPTSASGPTATARSVHGAADAPRGGLQHLSAREREILALVALGLTEKRIGRQLTLSPLTVKSHKTRIVHKLGSCGKASNSVAIGWARGYLRNAPRPGGPRPELSAREHEVLARLPYGLTNQQIAAQLHLSCDTVKTHLRSVMRKLGVRTRAHAVLRGFQTGLLQATPRERS